MPRATIPYDDLQRLAEEKYPEPLYINVNVTRKDRNSYGVKAPTRVYDRSTGNFAAIGWKVQISMAQFVGVRDNRGRFETKYQNRFIDDILFTD